MTRNHDWIADLTAEATEHHPSVTQAVSDSMFELIASQLSHGQLARGELRHVASVLLAKMVPSEAQTEETE